MKKFNKIVYHDKCNDGYGALAVVHKYYKGDNTIEVFPGTHGQNPVVSEFENMDVLFVDFSYKKDILKEIVSVANSVTVIDHHVSVYEDISSISEIDYIYDIDKSGAELAWEYFYPDTPTPLVVSLIGDRDLWRHNEDADHLSLALVTLGYTHIEISSLLDANDNEIYSLIEKGKSFSEYKWSLIKKLAETSDPNHKLEDGAYVNIVNCPLGLVSDLGHYLCSKEGTPDITLLYHRDEAKEMINYSLRVSDDCDYDSSAYAKSMGGGGHRRSSGFSIPDEI